MLARLRSILFMTMIPVLLLAAGCNHAQVPLTQSDNGRHVTLQKGDQLVMGLEGNPSTGYSS